MLVPEPFWAVIARDALAGSETALIARRARRLFTPQAIINIDRYGRMALPRAVCRRAGLKGHVVVTQTTNSLQIQPQNTFEKELDSVRRLNAEIHALAHVPLMTNVAALLPPATASTSAHPILETPPDKIAQLSAARLQLFARECFWQMGYHCSEIGSTFTADGGIDLVAYSPPTQPFPWVLAVQVTTCRNKVGPAKLRELAGTLQSLPVHVGVLITNSTFSAQARWYAKQFNEKHRQKLWLRDLEDLQCWSRREFAARRYSDDVGFAIELYHGGTFVIEKGFMSRQWPNSPMTSRSRPKQLSGGTDVR